MNYCVKTSYRCTLIGQVHTLMLALTSCYVTFVQYHMTVVGMSVDHAGNSCPQGCYGRGDCIDGQCRCFAGFTGWDCKHSQYSSSPLYLICI